MLSLIVSFCLLSPARGAEVAPLRSAVLANRFTRACVAALTSAPREVAVDRLLRRALRQQIEASPLAISLSAANSAALTKYPALIRYWRILTLFPDIEWTERNATVAEAVTRSVVGPMKLIVASDSSKRSTLWIDFEFQDAPTSKPFEARARRILRDFESPGNYSPDPPVRIFNWDHRTKSVLALVSDHIDDIDRRTVEATDHIGDWSYRYVKALIQP